MLNAYSAEELEEADYDLRLDGYNRLPKLLVGSSSRVAMPLLCLRIIHDAELDDIALKHSASHSITLIAKHCASQPDGGPHRAIMERVLMPALRRGLRLPAEKDALRQDMLRLLGATLLILPSLQPEMASLLSPHEPEADFFQNVTHVQMPRRQRALARLRQRVAAGAFSAATMSGYLLPMLRHLVLRPDAKEVDVAEEAVQTLSEVCRQLPWRPYLSTLQAFTRMLKKQPSLEKRLLRAMVATLDAFHYDLTITEEAALAITGEEHAPKKAREEEAAVKDKDKEGGDGDGAEGEEEEEEEEEDDGGGGGGGGGGGQGRRCRRAGRVEARRSDSQGGLSDAPGAQQAAPRAIRPPQGPQD